MTNPVEPQDTQQRSVEPRPRSVLRRPGWWVTSVAVLAIAALSSGWLLSGGAQVPAKGGLAASAKPTARIPRPEHPGGASTTPSAPASSQKSKQPASAHSKGPFTLLNNGSVSVCSLITGDQVNQIVGERLPTPVPVAVGTFDECATSKRRTDPSAARILRIAWAVPPQPEPARTFRQLTINLPRSDAVQGLGDRAYCSSQGRLSTELFILKGRHFVEVFADTCAHDVALAQIALRRL